MMKKRLSAMFLAMLMILSLAGCGKTPEVPEEPDVPPVEEKEPEKTPEVVEPEPPVEEEPAARNPLTGLAIDPAYVNLRPVAVIFNNLKIAMPQLGVSQADIIYEIPAEGGITRMLGVFQSMEGVGTLGSIRSARPYYMEAALGHDALFVHAGGSPDAYKKIKSWDVDNMDGVQGGSDAQIFWRDSARRSSMGYEHSLLTSGEKVQEYLNKGYFDLEHGEDYVYSQTFAADGTPAGGTAAERFEVKFSNTKTGVFEYDAETKQYKVGQYGGEYIDGNSGRQVSVTNVLVLETDIHIIPGDTAGRLSVKMTGEGNGTYFCGGQSVAIRWSKADTFSPFVYTLENGEPLTMGRGTSYVCIMDPADSTLTIG